MRGSIGSVIDRLGLPASADTQQTHTQNLTPGGCTYATCFICGEQGHLSSQCSQNEKGLYPKGGCCHRYDGVQFGFEWVSVNRSIDCIHGVLVWATLC